VTSITPHQALYRRWRAQTFAQIVGQEAVVETLRNAVRLDRVAHAILFVGPRGTGKTSLARILAKAINCTNLQDGDACDTCPSCVAIREGRAIDLVEIDAASNRGIDAIRELRERINYAPTDLRKKVYILDEAHQITRDAWNALLKSLEEPPDFVVFMFASTHPQEFPPAILSRLQRYDVRRLTVAEIEGKLNRILDADGRPAEPAAVRLIARLAAGGMRDAESMLDQLIASSGNRLDEARVRDLLGLADAEAVRGFVDALVTEDAGTGIRILDALDERGRDARIFLDQVVDAIRSELVAVLAATGAKSDRSIALAAAARRLASIDPNRAGTGGLRLQLELALFGAADLPGAVGQMAAPTDEAATPAAAAQPPAAAAPTEPIPAPAATTRAPAIATPAPATATPAPATATPAPATATPDPPTATRKPTASVAPGVSASAASAEKEPAASAAEPAAATPAEDGQARPVGPGRPAQPPSPSATDGDLGVLLEKWRDIVESVRPATRAVITECRPLAVEGNVVTLGFPEAKAFLKDIAERKRPDLETAVGGFLGRAVTVRCVATNIDLVPALSDADSDFVLNEARRIFADDLADVGEVS
jgi:DNA polymerase-3 subunit gamma/tau